MKQDQTTENEIFKRVAKIKKEQGVLETELDLLWIELQVLKNPKFTGWAKHPW